MSKRVTKRIYLILLLILVLHIFVRLKFLMNLVNADPQDDGIYVNYIKEICRGEYDIKLFSELVKEKTVNHVRHIRTS
ncbi:MAG: hypothetical protein J7K98_04255 [Candidatus Aenigmarchaeota archaeon]|nr:hypothetical protein [Candidatus Aenigmarchaeota archaeon]